MRTMDNQVNEDKKYNQMLRIIIAVFLSFAGVYYLPYIFSVGEENIKYTNGIFAFFLFFLILKAFNQVLSTVDRGKRRQWFISTLTAALFSVSMAFGKALAEHENVKFTDKHMWVAIVIYTIIFSLLLRFLWEKLHQLVLQGNCRGKAKKEPPAWIKKAESQSDWHTWLITALILFICWLPVLLAVYPGFFVYDAQDEYMQVATRHFTTHHPLFHVLMLGGIIHLIYKLTGSYNMGIACYTLLQMLVLSGIFSYGILVLKKKGVSFWLRVTSILYFGFFPVIVMFSLCSAKDGLFTGMLLLLFLFLNDLCQDPELFWHNEKKQLGLIGSAIGMMLLRHNGMYAYLALCVVFIVVMKQYRRQIGILMIAAVFGYGVISAGMTFFLHAYDEENQEILTVPIQQMARVYNSEKNNLDQEDLETLYEILPAHVLRMYTPKVSDSVKIHFNNEAFAKNPVKYLTLWGKWGLQHPFTYLNAWFMTSYGFWYPDTVIDVYRGNSVFTFTYEDSSYFGYEVEEPGIRYSRLPWLNEWYRKMSLEITQQKIPVVSMLFSPGFMFWVMVFVMGYLWYEKRYDRLLPYLLPLLVWLTVILGPTYLVRYVLFLWFLLPFFYASVMKIDKYCKL